MISGKSSAAVRMRCARPGLQRFNGWPSTNWPLVAPFPSEVVRDVRVARDQPFNGRARGSSVEAADDDVGVFYFLTTADVFRNSLPSQTPEEVDS